MSDPLADPRAADLLAALPDDVAALAANFRTAADESRGTVVGLSAAQHDGTWTGGAADAFRRAIGRLPAELEKVRAGFEAVADALTVYEGELARIKAAFARVTAELSDVGSRFGPAQATAHATEIATLRRRAFDLLDEFTAARSACRAAIAVAENTAPAPRRTGQGTTVLAGGAAATGRAASGSRVLLFTRCGCERDPLSALCTLAACALRTGRCWEPP